MRVTTNKKRLIRGDKTVEDPSLARAHASIVSKMIKKNPV